MRKKGWGECRGRFLKFLKWISMKNISFLIFKRKVRSHGPRPKHFNVHALLLGFVLNKLRFKFLTLFFIFVLFF